MLEPPSLAPKILRETMSALNQAEAMGLIERDDDLHLTPAEIDRLFSTLHREKIARDSIGILEASR